MANVDTITDAEKEAWQKTAAANGVVLGSVDLNDSDDMRELYGMLGVTGVAAKSRLRALISEHQQRGQQDEVVNDSDTYKQQHDELREEVRQLKKIVIEKTVNESRAVSYAEYYDDRMQEGRIEMWHPQPHNQSWDVNSVDLPECLRKASNNIGSEKDVVRPFWKRVLSQHEILPTWNNGYETAHLGTKVPDIAVFPRGLAKPSSGDFVAAGDCKGNAWTGTSSAEKGQIMLYVHRMLDAQPERLFGYGFVTNNRIIVLVKGYRSSEPPYIIRWCLSSVLTFEHGMKFWLQLMREDSGYRQPPVVAGFPIMFRQTLRPGGTCRAFGASYRGDHVVAKLYANSAIAEESASRTARAAAIVSDAAKSHALSLAQVPSVVATEGSWAVITPKGTPLSIDNLSKIHIEQLINSLKVVHAAGIVHRDVRVANIFYLTDGKILLNDWGSSVGATETTLYAGAPSPHIHPEIPIADMYLPSAHHDLYSLVSSLSQLLFPGANRESRESFFAEAYQAANACDYEGVCRGITRHMR